MAATAVVCVLCMCPDGGGAGDGSGDGSSAGGDGSGSSSTPTYVLFDGREDVLLWWQSELSREEKEEALHVDEHELGRALQRATMGADSGTDMHIEEEKLRELRDNAELMTAARCIFIDAVYNEGKAKSMSDPGAPPTADSQSLDLILHSVLGVIERHVLLMYERHSLHLRFMAVVLFWIWAWSHWAWWVRYPLMILLGFAVVAASAAAATVAGPAEQAAALSPFWTHIGHGFLRFKALLLRPFDDPTNPVLLRARTDIFLSAVLVLDHARWVSSGKYWLLLFISLLLPAGILALEKGGGGWNNGVAALHRTTKAADANGLRYLRMLFISISCLAAVHYSGSTWTSFVFVSAFFFPSFTTIALSSTALAITGAFMMFSKVQQSLLGEYSAHRLAFWSVWLTCDLALFTGDAGAYGWLVWLACWSGALLFTPPPVSFVVQIVCGGICSVLLSVGLIPACNVVLKIMQLLLTREGMTQIGVLIAGQCNTNTHT